MINTTFGKLNNGVLEYAPTTIITDNSEVTSTDPHILINYGYKPIIKAPYPQDSIVYKPSYIDNGTTILVNWEADLEQTKAAILTNIEKYDTSDAVNEFIINGIGMWLDGDTQRPKLRGAVQTYLDKELGDYPLCVEGVGVIPVAPTKLLSMLADIEVYAIECFTKTFEHKEAVNALTTCEELVSYDYTEGYPEKLVFNL